MPRSLGVKRQSVSKRGSSSESDSEVEVKSKRKKSNSRATINKPARPNRRTTVRRAKAKSESENELSGESKSGSDESVEIGNRAAKNGRNAKKVAEPKKPNRREAPRRTKVKSESEEEVSEEDETSEESDEISSRKKRNASKKVPEARKQPNKSSKSGNKKAKSKTLHDSDLEDDVSQDSPVEKKNGKTSKSKTLHDSDLEDEVSQGSPAKSSSSDLEINEDGSDDSIPRKTRRKRTMMKKESDESSEGESKSDGSSSSPAKRGKTSKKASKKNSKKKDEEESRHKLRKVIDDKKLNKSTLDALEQENERKKRIENKKKALNDSQLKFEKESTLCLDVTKDGKRRIPVDPTINSVLKPHQIEGIQFMWDSCFENVEMIAKGDKGSGCLLAHCMGLGKTLQVVSLIHTLLANQEETKVERVLVLLPVNVLLNWSHEFDKWTSDCDYQVDVYSLPNENSGGLDMVKMRLKKLEKWTEKGGVFLIGYTMFARLVQGVGIKNKSMKTRFTKCLLGADVVICDEGHLLKSEKTNIAKAAYQVETLRRIVLTGTPLQNNLAEYHCMVSFVKPNLLGTRKEFMNRFVNPINNGQHRDSTEADVRLMKKRAHVLHNILDGCVQRKDYDIIRTLLPPKNEYVLLIRLSEKQRILYKQYLEEIRGIKNVNALGKVAGAQLFTDFQALTRIWTHPWVLHLNQYRMAIIESRNMKSFVNDESSAVETEDEVEPKENAANTIVKQADDRIAVEVVKDDDSISMDSNSLSQNYKGNSKKKRVVFSDDDEELIESGDGSSDDSVVKTKRKGESTDESDVSESEQFKYVPPTRTTRRQALTALAQEKKKSNGKIANTIESDLEDPIPEEEEEKEEQHWYSETVPPECEFDLTLSGKMVVFEQILQQCEEKGDKLIVFSQSLMSLDLIEKFLNNSVLSDQSWKKDVDYFRIDGSIDVVKRSKDCQAFNDTANTKARLYLISTKAGGIGINLVGANRCIIFDASWNPSYDTQSIFRIYRFGQVKPVFIYRFLAQGTMEEKIYQRQVTKQSLAQRVVDEHQLDRHFTSEELRELYKFEPSIYDPDIEELPMFPSDDVLKAMLLDLKQWIVSYHEHDSLLENKVSEGLSKEEREAAWAEYQHEKERANQPVRTYASYEEYLMANQHMNPSLVNAMNATNGTGGQDATGISMAQAYQQELIRQQREQQRAMAIAQFQMQMQQNDLLAQQRGGQLDPNLEQMQMQLQVLMNQNPDQKRTIENLLAQQRRYQLHQNLQNQQRPQQRPQPGQQSRSANGNEQFLAHYGASAMNNGDGEYTSYMNAFPAKQTGNVRKEQPNITNVVNRNINTSTSNSKSNPQLASLVDAYQKSRNTNHRRETLAQILQISEDAYLQVTGKISTAQQAPKSPPTNYINID